MRQFVSYILLFVLGAAAGMLLPRSCINTAHRDEVETRVDTLYVRDTAVEIRPVFDAEIAVPDMAVVIEDSIIVKDDSLLVLPMQQRHYKGDNYEAWVSGYRPQLDSVWVFPETRYITTENIFAGPRKCNSIALEASASWCGRASLLLSLEYMHEWRRWYAGASAGYDVVTGSPYVGARIGLPLWRW